MANFNLSDAAKNVLLGEDSKSTFDSNISGKMSQRLKDGNRVGLNKVDSKTAYGTNDVGKIGDSPNDVNDPLPDYTKGTPSATPPGATPPVSSQPMMKIKQQPGQEGSKTISSTQGTENSYDQIRDRVAAKLAKQTMPSNKGSVGIQSYGEEAEVEYDDEEEIIVEAEKEEGHEDEAQDKKLIKKMVKKSDLKEKMAEDIDALMSGENLSEEFVSKATTIFEAAVIARAEMVIEEAEAELMEQFEEAVESIKEDLAAKVDDYLNYMVEEWIKENQIAIETGLRSEIVEDFITGLKGLFEQHYIDIPEEKVNVVEELADKVESLEDALNDEIQKNIMFTRVINEHRKNEAIHTACEGLTQTQVEKIKSLAESIEFTTEEEFADKMETLKGSYFPTNVKSAESSDLNEEIQFDDSDKKVKSADPMMNYYADAITKTMSK